MFAEKEIVFLVYLKIVKQTFSLHRSDDKS